MSQNKKIMQFFALLKAMYKNKYLVLFKNS